MSNVKILGISASPRKLTTEFLINKALVAAEETGSVETDIISLAKKHINPCLACKKCQYPCIQKDDMQEMYDKLLAADGIIFGSPVYWGTVTAQAKAFIDRLRPFCLYNSHSPVSGALKNKVLGALTIAYDRNGGQEFTLLTILQAFMMHNTVIVGTGHERPIGSYYGGSSIGYPDGTLEACKNDKIGIFSCESIGRRVAEVTKMIKASSSKDL